jgi:hypothetical protein
MVRDALYGRDFMIRPLVAATLTFALTIPAPVWCEDAEAVPKIEKGARVLVFLGQPDDPETNTIRGKVLSLNSNGLTVREEETGTRVSLDRSDVLRILIKTSGTRERAARIGAIVGGTIGLLVTAGLTIFLSLVNEDGCSGGECIGFFAIGVAAVGGTGALLGAGVGYALGHDGWRDAYLPQATSEMFRRGSASLRVGMAKGGGARIELKCSF